MLVDSPLRSRSLRPKQCSEALSARQETGFCKSEADLPDLVNFIGFQFKVKKSFQATGHRSTYDFCSAAKFDREHLTGRFPQPSIVFIQDFLIRLDDPAPKRDLPLRSYDLWLDRTKISLTRGWRSQITNKPRAIRQYELRFNDAHS